MTADLVESTIGPARRALEDAGLTADKIDKVILVGGSTRIPAVSEAVKKLTGKEPHKGINPDECVAVGAALQAGVLTGDVTGLLLLDVTPLSLGIETYGGVFTKLIERNTTIPTKKSQIFSTAADNQTNVEVHVLQGERELAAYNKTLGRFTLSGIPMAPRGVPQIEVTFDIDANGIVHVSAKDLGTGNEQNITITASTNLTDDEIDKAVKEAEKFAEEDKKRKEEVEIKNNAESLCVQVERSIKELGDKISESEKSELESLTKDLKDKAAGTDYEAIKAATEALTNKFSEISTKLYQQAAQQQQAQGGAQQTGPNGETVVDTDYDVVDDDKKE